MASILKVDEIQDISGKKILQNTGGVLQVVEGTRTDGTNTASSSYVDAGLSASITPTSSSSKVLVIVAAGFGNTSASTNNNVRILRDSTEIRSFSRVAFQANGHVNAHQIFTVLDSPSTTSATTYKVQYMTDGGNFRINDSSGDTSVATITLMEISA
jgi:hypothetical protein|tara:strand:- start:411 stop:881 length:471 start_codon:yes stop_codon:yes gene_type:complete